jgi:predicted ATPase
MIRQININNFKSIEHLEFELGSRLNVIIGANGSGKTNILEAIAFGAAASSNKLDYEFLGNRIRVTSPEFMRNAFIDNKNKEITLHFKMKTKEISYILINDKNDYRRWIDLNKENAIAELNTGLKKLFTDKNFVNEIELETGEKQFFQTLNELILKDKNSEKDINNIIPLFTNQIIDKEFSNQYLSDFLIYTPELSYLKKFEEPAQIIPIGIKGEGLFYELKKLISNTRKSKQINDIKENLHLLDWFEDFDIPSNLMSNEYKISIKDRFISSSNFFDQRSSNEGFLFLLFYLFLFTSETTPHFFAIDNIETGFNPKLCTQLMINLNELSKTYKKQVIITTHNPAILDGIDLKDDAQRLFIAIRNKNGKTYLERITEKPQSKIKLSELWMKGYIGGLPDNF